MEEWNTTTIEDDVTREDIDVIESKEEQKIILLILLIMILMCHLSL